MPQPTTASATPEEIEEDEPWSYPPSDDPEVQASREATGLLCMTYRAGYYQGWWSSMNNKHKMPQPGVLNFAPPPDQVQKSSDNSLSMVAVRIALLIEGDEDIMNADHPNVNELTEADWKALLPTEEL